MNSRLLTLLLGISFFVQTSIFAQFFSEQSSSLGIDHSMQATGLMGGGAAFFDFDNDGWDDLYLTSGESRDVLYRNQGNGTFIKTPNSNGLNATIQSNTTAVATGDIDNDGDIDIFVSTWNNNQGDRFRNLLFKNNGNGTFLECGITAGIIHEAFSIGATFFDFNQDGFLDIYVINHVETPAFLQDNTGSIIGFDHECFNNFLYQNNGDGTFVEVGADLGIDDGGCALATLSSDFDMDGDLDVLIANDFGPFLTPNVLYQNEFPTLSFNDIGSSVGAAIPMYGMGIASGDFDQDLDIDYYITNLGSNVLMENNDFNFIDIALAAGVTNEFANSSFDFSTGWGTAFFDIDNDSWLDLFVANGRIPSLSSLPTAFQDPNKLYINNGDKTFLDISDSNAVNDSGYGRGMAYSDFDKDGDLDFVMVNLNEFGATTKFYVNDSNNDNNYIQFVVSSVNNNKNAFGTKIWVHGGGRTFLQENNGGAGSFCSQHSTVMHFGLGEDIASIDSIIVQWPNGEFDKFGSFEINKRYKINDELINTLTNSYDNGKVSIYPNPTKEDITINFGDLNSGSVQLELLTTDGQLLKKYTPNFSKRLIITLNEDIMPGIYFLRIVLDNHFSIIKLIKY